MPNLYHRPPLPGRLYNRLRAVMLHGRRYAFGGVGRLAEDTGVSLSTMKRLLRGETSPSYKLIERITAALRERGLYEDA